MAPVSIDQGMPSPEEPALEVSRERWKLLAMARRRWAEVRLPFDCRLLKQVRDEAPILAEAMGYESGDQFLTDYLSLDLELVQRVVGWLEQEKPTYAVPLALVEAATSAQAKPLAPAEIGIEGGKPGPGRGNKTVADSHGLTPSRQLSSDSQERILRRLARDAPEILERVKAGEFRSARAAAIEAGIIKPVPTIRLTADMPAVANRICQHLTPEQVRSLCEALLCISTTPTTDKP